MARGGNRYRERETGEDSAYCESCGDTRLVNWRCPNCDNDDDIPPGE